MMEGKTCERVLSLESKYNEIGTHIADIFARFDLNVRGKSVLIKPNLLFYAEPEQGLNTHPAMVEAVVRECERQGASRVMVGDNAGQPLFGNSRRAFMESAGFGDRLGQYYVNLGLDLMPCEFAPLNTTLYVPKLLKEAEVVINMPKMKTHLSTGLSGAVKNTFGYIPGAQKSKLHLLANDYGLFGRVLVGVHMLRKPDLNIIDGILAMQAGGPFSRSLHYLRCVLVSTDALAADCVMCSIMGMKPEGIPYLRAARDMGMGVLEDFEVIGNLPAAPGFTLPPGFDGITPLREAFISTGQIQDSNRTVPKVSKETCTKCGECIRQCPTKTLAADRDGFPVMTDSPCASCHACQEVCDRKALFLDIPDGFSPDKTSYLTWESPTVIPY